MKFTFNMLSLALVLTFAPLASAEAEMVDNPDYVHWSQFAPGSYATIAGKTTVGEGAQSMEIQSQRTAKLVSINDQEAVVEQTILTTMPGMGPMEPMVTTATIPAQVEAGQEQDMLNPEAKIAEGQEQITIAGETYDAKWVEYQMTEQGVSMTAKSWFVEEVPGRQIKMTAKGDGQMMFVSELELNEHEAK